VIEFDATYFDGRTSARRAVRVRADGDRLHVSGSDLEATIPLAEIRSTPPITGTRYVLHLPSGAQLHTDDAPAVAALLPAALHAESWLRKLESRWTYTAAAVGVIALFSALVILYGVPFAAKHVAERLPAGLETELEGQTLAAIDRVCSPSALSPSRQNALRLLLKALAEGLPAAASYRLELRSCGTRFGPNAFALPGTTIVVTDELVTLAQNDAQLSAVLAHEVGHVLHRHSTRMALQAAGLAALVTALAGDAVSITGLAVAIPTVLLETGYSRKFEEEADAFAFRRMKEVGLSPRAFADMMKLLENHEQRARGARGKGESDMIDYLSTHPATQRRIERALAADR
jgi:Zn-dependent protease with chaperone function